MANPEPASEFITLAFVLKTQGRRGEVAVAVHTDVPDRFQPAMRLSALLKSNERREVVVEEFWPHKGTLVLKFQGIETISDAESLVGAELQVPAGQRAALEPGWTYLSDLVGCMVYDGDHAIGPVVDVQFGAGEAPLLVVKGAAKLPYEIPFAEAFLVKLDPGEKKIWMRLPEGLLDVNAPLSDEDKRR